MDVDESSAMLAPPSSSSVTGQSSTTFSLSTPPTTALKLKPKSLASVSVSSKGKRKSSALGESEVPRSSKRAAQEPGPAAILYGFRASVDSIKDEIFSHKVVSPNAILKDAVEKLDGAWGIEDQFTMAEKTVLRKIFADESKKAVVYTSTVDSANRRSWADLELMQQPYAEMLRRLEEKVLARAL
jgi:hypothetical protein